MPNAAKNPPDHEEVGVGGEGDEEEPGKEERADQPTNLKWKIVKILLANHQTFFLPSSWPSIPPRRHIGIVENILRLAEKICLWKDMFTNIILHLCCKNVKLT